MASARAPEIDAVLHRERLDGRAKRRHVLPCAIDDLPDGVMIAVGDDAFLIVNGRALRWSFDGYGNAATDLADATLLTPPSTLRALMAGYAAVVSEV